MSSATTNSLPPNLAHEREGPHGHLDWRDRAICAVLCLVTLAIYIQAAGFDFVDYDDGIYVTSNWHVQRGLTLDNLQWAFTTDRGGYWHPVTLLCYLAISTLLGPRAGAFHVVN